MTGETGWSEDNLTELLEEIRLLSADNQGTTEGGALSRSDIEKAADAMVRVYGTRALAKARDMERRASDKLFAKLIVVELERRGRLRVQDAS